MKDSVIIPPSGLKTARLAAKKGRRQVSHHPTQWAQNEEEVRHVLSWFDLSPSHPVGSERSFHCS